LRIITLILIFVLLFGITYGALSARDPAFPGAEVAVLIGFILLIANVTGSLAALSGLPRLTRYLIVGVLARPSISGLVSVEGLERADAGVDLRSKTWQGLISQGGVTLGSDIVTLGMAIIIGSMLGGPILLERAITAPALPELGPEAEVEPGLESAPEPEPVSRAPMEGTGGAEQSIRTRYTRLDDWAGDA
jgi:hypothetical protein